MHYRESNWKRSSCDQTIASTREDRMFERWRHFPKSVSKCVAPNRDRPTARDLVRQPYDRDHDSHWTES